MAATLFLCSIGLKSGHALAKFAQRVGILSEKLHAIRFCESMKKFHIVLYLLAKSDIIPIRKQGGENYGKNGEYQCPY